MQTFTGNRNCSCDDRIEVKEGLFDSVYFPEGKTKTKQNKKDFYFYMLVL